MYIETIQANKINEIIADTNFIHAAYRILKVGVKQWTRKKGPLANNKGKSMGSDSPFRDGIANEIQRIFRTDIYGFVVIRIFNSKRFNTNRST